MHNLSSRTNLTANHLFLTIAIENYVAYNTVSYKQNKRGEMAGT